MTTDIEEVRARLIEELTQKWSRAEGRSSDPFWRSGHHTPMKWVAKAFSVAIKHVRDMQPEPAEPMTRFFQRVSARVRDCRDDGPDFDDEAWFSSAIDEASALISCSAAEPIAPHRKSDSGPARL